MLMLIITRSFDHACSVHLYCTRCIILANHTDTHSEVAIGAHEQMGLHRTHVLWSQYAQQLGIRLQHLRASPHNSAELWQRDDHVGRCIAGQTLHLASSDQCDHPYSRCSRQRIRRRWQQGKLFCRSTHQ